MRLSVLRNWNLQYQHSNNEKYYSEQKRTETMKTRHWIYYTAIIILAWLLLDIGFGMDRYTKFPSWQWLLGFVLRNAGVILLLLLGKFVGMKSKGKEE